MLIYFSPISPILSVIIIMPFPSLPPQQLAFSILTILKFFSFIFVVFTPISDPLLTADHPSNGSE